MVEVDIPSQTALVNDEINSLQTNKNKSERLEYYSAQKEVLLTYVKHTLFILYYIVFIMMGVALLAKRQEFGLMFVAIILVFFGIFPLFVDYVATYAYYRWLDIMHYFYVGNTAYLYQPDKDRVNKIKTPETSSFSTCTGGTCCPTGTTYDGKKCVPDGCVGSKCCPTGTTYNENYKICVPNVVPLGTPNADNTWKPFFKEGNTLEWRNPATATPSGCGGLDNYNSITLACCPTGSKYDEPNKACK